MRGRSVLPVCLVCSNSISSVDEAATVSEPEALEGSEEGQENEGYGQITRSGNSAVLEGGM